MADVGRGDQDSIELQIKLSPERSMELKRLADAQNQPVNELAKELLETEIEAQHGLRYGPPSRRFLYRQ